MEECYTGPKWNRISSSGNTFNITKYIMNGVDFVWKIVDRLWLGNTVYFLASGLLLFTFR